MARHLQSLSKRLPVLRASLSKQLTYAARMPPRTSFETIDCSIARTMAVLGEPWTALILRDLFIGVARFDALHTHLGVSRKVLTERLTRLVNEEIVVKRAYAQRPERFDYVLTGKGWEICD